MHESDRRWRDFYDGWAPRYDFGMRVGALLRGFSDSRERRKMIERLRLAPGQRVLEVSVGTGANLPLMYETLGPGGALVGLDISTGMLLQCRKKAARLGIAAGLVEGEASRLPFPGEAFDAVLHFGGINEFGDKQGAIAEMVRVARPGAKIVIADEGLNPNKPRSLRNRLLARIAPIYENRPPLDLVPQDVRDVNVTWFRADCCYLMDFAKAS